MGSSVGKPKDIWIVIYEKGIADAAKVQKNALKLTVEGKLSGHANVSSARSPHSALIPGSNASATGGGAGPLSAPAIVNYQQQPQTPPVNAQQQQQQQREREQKEMQSYNHYSLSDSGNHTPTGWGPSGGPGAGGGGGGPSSVAPAPAAPTQLDKFAAIKTFVESEWTAKDRKDSRSHAQKLWKQYHSSAARAAGKDSSAFLSLEELTELTKDSLTTLHSHMHLFINSMYEDMKKTTQICMINLMQRYRYGAPHQSHSAQTSLNHHHHHHGHMAGAGGMGGANSFAGTGLSGAGNLSGGNTLSVGGGGGGATMNLGDIEWLNDQIEAEKKSIMQVLNTQIEEWMEHYVDVAEAIFDKMDTKGDGKINKTQFADNFGAAIYEVVGPHFFSQHLPAVGSTDY